MVWFLVKLQNTNTYTHKKKTTPVSLFFETENKYSNTYLNHNYEDEIICGIDMCISIQKQTSLPFLSDPPLRHEVPCFSLHPWAHFLGSPAEVLNSGRRAEQDGLNVHSVLPIPTPELGYSDEISLWGWYSIIFVFCVCVFFNFKLFYQSHHSYYYAINFINVHLN